MNLEAQQAAALAALRNARAEGSLPPATPGEDDEVLREIEAITGNLLEAVHLPAETYRKALADLSRTLTNAHRLLAQVTKAPAALQAIVSTLGDTDLEALEPALLSVDADLQALAEVSRNASECVAAPHRLTITSLIVRFAPLYKRYTGRVPAGRRYVDTSPVDRTFVGKPYGPFLDFICALGATFEIEAGPEGVMTALGRMYRNEEDKIWLKRPWRPASEILGPELENLRAAGQI